MATFQLKYNLIIGCKSKNRPQFKFWETCCSCLFLPLNFSHKIVWAEKQPYCFAKCFVQTDTIVPSLTCSKVDFDWVVNFIATGVLFLSFNKIDVLHLNTAKKCDVSFCSSVDTWRKTSFRFLICPISQTHKNLHGILGRRLFSYEIAKPQGPANVPSLDVEHCSLYVGKESHLCKKSNISELIQCNGWRTNH